MITLWLGVFCSCIQASLQGTFRETIPLLSGSKELILDFHNVARRQVATGAIAGQPSASDMIELRWSDELSVKALEWSQRCNWWHRSSDPNAISNICGTAGFSFIGENLAAGNRPGVFPEWPTDQWDVHFVLNESMSGWFDEYKVYNFYTGSCAQGECGHYTQMVWSRTKYVGCALSVCSSISNLGFGGASYLFVCNYGPGGNIYLNSERIPSYKTGSPCSQCPADRPVCSHQLCSGQGELPCRDDSNIFTCKYYKKRGYCDLCSKYYWQAKVECNATCNLCIPELSGGSTRAKDSGNSAVRISLCPILTIFTFYAFVTSCKNLWF